MQYGPIYIMVEATILIMLEKLTMLFPRLRLMLLLLLLMLLLLLLLLLIILEKLSMPPSSSVRS